jgi:hypothetical protein
MFIETELERTSALNSLSGTIVEIAAIGADVHIYVVLDSGERIVATRKNSGRPIERIGETIRVTFAPEDGALTVANTD